MYANSKARSCHFFFNLRKVANVFNSRLTGCTFCSLLFVLYAKSYDTIRFFDCGGHSSCIEVGLPVPSERTVKKTALKNFLEKAP